MFQAAAAYFVCILCASILIGTFTVFLSSLFKSPFGVIIITSLLIFAPLFFNVPESNVPLYNLLRLLPSNMTISIWLAVSRIPYEIFGVPVLSHIFLPLFAVMVSVILLPFARRAFKHHQIG
jgi:hypothetical protein